MSICDRAKDARARNSPGRRPLRPSAKRHTLAGPPVALGGRETPPALLCAICDQAQSARPETLLAPQLVARCRAIGGGRHACGDTPDQLAAKGQSLASQDPMVGELRRRQPVANQRGFDIGIGAAGGDTVWGPGKQKILTSLNAPQQEGFKVAVSFRWTATRTRRLLLLAPLSPKRIRCRQCPNSDPDVRAWLGFDIASGIFGNPAKGAQNKMGGMQFMAIREQLSLPAQRGFNASMNSIKAGTIRLLIKQGSQLRTRLNLWN